MSLWRAILAGSVLVLLSGGMNPCRGQGAVAISNVTVIDATGAPPKPHATVLIDGGRITEIGDAAAVKFPAGATVIDGAGKFLIPGLWDMHVHWYETDALPIFIANGVTGIRLMWGFPQHYGWRRKIEAGSLLGPRLLIGSTIVDGPNPVWPGSIVAGNAVEGRQAVQQAIEEGADFVKVYSKLPREAYFAIAGEAKKRGIPFEGHVPDAVTILEASDAGQATMEHMLGMTGACATPEKTEAVFAKLKNNHTWQCPTLTVMRIIDCMGNSGGTNDERLRYMRSGLRDYWVERMGVLNRMALPLQQARQNTYHKNLALIGGMERAGVDILAGTDTGNPFCFPGFSLHDELGLLVEAGLTPMQALQTATRNPARFMGREKELGTVEKGKLADLVLLEANPLDNIGNTKRIFAVVYRGNVYSKAALDGMLDKIQARVKATLPGIGELLLRTLTETNVDAVIARYRQLKSTQSSAYDFGEDQLNIMGYALMEQKKTAEAIRMLELNAELFPKSANVYDSLGDACAKSGNRAEAEKNYRRSLELNPANANAIRALKRLSAPPAATP